MARPPDRQVRPQVANQGAQMTTGRDVNTSITPTPVDLAHPIVALIHEIKPTIPLSVVASLVVECLDLSACMILDGQWAEARQAAWPEAIKAAHSRHAGQSYADRHRDYLEAS